MTTPRLKQRFNPFSLMIFWVLFVLTVPGCSDGGSGTDADPTGYYPNIGTASVSDSRGGIIGVSDLQAMVSDNRIMMMSVANKLLYDGLITNISGNNFTADFTIYTDGENPIDTMASGTIIEGSKIEGTLMGSGAGNGTFSLFVGAKNNEESDVSNSINALQEILDNARK